jgi:hypothetical protein
MGGWKDGRKEEVIQHEECRNTSIGSVNLTPCICYKRQEDWCSLKK